MNKRAFNDNENASSERITRQRLKDRLQSGGFASQEDQLESITLASERVAEEWIVPLCHADSISSCENLPAIYTKMTRATLPYTGNGSLRYTALVRVLEALHMSSDSVFCDLGCGAGNVLVCALMRFGVRAAIGIEVDEPTLEAGRAAVAKATHAQQVDRMLLLHGDLMHWKKLPPYVTHVFSYDRVMPGSVLVNIARMLNLLKPKIFISFQKPDVWAALGLDAKFVEAIGKCNTTGAQTFTAFRFEF